MLLKLAKRVPYFSNTVPIDFVLINPLMKNKTKSINCSFNMHTYELANIFHIYVVYVFVLTYFEEKNTKYILNYYILDWLKL